MEFTFGHTNPTTVEVTNRQQHVEYKILNNFADAYYLACLKDINQQG